METRIPEEVEAYAQQFWTRYKELPEWDKMIKSIEKGEVMIQQKQLSIQAIESKCKGKKFYDEIEFNKNIYSKFRSKLFSADHDKYLVFANYRLGYGNWHEIRMGIKREEAFEFDHYFKSRTEGELNKRMSSLLRVIKAEEDHNRREQYFKDMESGKIDPEEQAWHESRFGKKQTQIKDELNGNNGTETHQNGITNELAEIDEELVDEPGHHSPDSASDKENLKTTRDDGLHKNGKSRGKPSKNGVHSKPEEPLGKRPPPKRDEELEPPMKSGTQSNLNAFFKAAKQ